MKSRSRYWIVSATMMALSLLTLFLDSLNSAWVGGGIPYILIVSVSYFISNRRSTLIVAIATSLLLLGGYQLGQVYNTLDGSMVYRIWVLLGIWAMAVLIHQMKQKESELERNQNHLSALFEAATEGIIISDRQGDILSVNSKAEELFGYDREEFQGMKIEDLIPKRYSKRHKSYRRDYYEDPEPRPMGQGRELHAMRKGGKEFPVEISLNSFKTDEGQFFIAFVIDITYRKQAEQELISANKNLKRKANELRQSNSELEQFAYVASHDLQEPLRMVASYTQLLERRYKDELDNDARDFINYAVDGANRMQQLINDLLEYSRVGTHGRELTPSDLNLILDVSQRHLQNLIEEENATVIVDASLPKVMGDETQLIQLFQNLIHNGIKFRGSESPKIRVWAEQAKDPDMVLIHVSDNGIGIDKAHQKRIFMIFQRLHNRSEYPGSGIGLAVCKKIVERHDGKIWLDSTPGEGTTFHLTLPFVTQEIKKEKEVYG